VDVEKESGKEHSRKGLKDKIRVGESVERRREDLFR
jgi:hypothetical protein